MRSVSPYVAHATILIASFPLQFKSHLIF
jgi:hypothetical protein